MDDRLDALAAEDEVKVSAGGGVQARLPSITMSPCCGRQLVDDGWSPAGYLRLGQPTPPRG